MKVERLPSTDSVSTGRTSSKADSLPKRWLVNTPAASAHAVAELDSGLTARGRAEDRLSLGEWLRNSVLSP